MDPVQIWTEWQVHILAALAALALMLAGLSLRRGRRARDAQLAELHARVREAEAERRQQEQRAAGLQAHLQSATEERDRYLDWWEAARANHAEVARQLSDLRQTHTELETRLQQKQLHFQEQLQLLRDNRDQLRHEFENLANEILERKGKAFSELSQQHISNLLQPMQHEMKGFRDKVETLHRHDTEQRASLRTELQTLQALNRDITDQARALTQALQGQRKVQGNWGELMLENVLEGSGLRPGKDYQRERSFQTAEGRRRPDAIVYLPQDKHLVIDAKTSLSAYVRYVNAEDDGNREQALREHCNAVRDRINELAERDYYRLPGLNSPEVVVMFIPVESAYVEALRYDDTLYQRAIESNVLVATPTTLLTSLNIVRQLWRFEDQSKHSAELARRAERFYNKLRGFLESMDDVARKLDGARESYDKAMAQLMTGRGNLIRQASDFRDLGVAVRRELPEHMVERARMELSAPGDPEAADQSGEQVPRRHD